MTRKDFEALALILKALKPDTGNRYAPRSVKTKGAAALAQWVEHVRAMANFCAVRNGHFNADRFYAACGFSADDIR